MFERFTTDARTAVTQARDRARDLGADHIGGDHLLLALSAGEGPAGDALTAAGIDPGRLTALIGGPELDADALAAIGIDLTAIRASADRTFGAGALDRATRSGRRGNLPFDKEAKKTLEIALREAIRLGHRSIDSGHLLLAALRLTDGKGHSLLLRVGGDPAALRADLERSSGLPRSA